MANVQEWKFLMKYRSTISNSRNRSSIDYIVFDLCFNASKTFCDGLLITWKKYNKRKKRNESWPGIHVIFATVINMGKYEKKTAEKKNRDDSEWEGNHKEEISMG